MKEKEMMATMSGKKDEQRMTSLDIAAVTGKQHKECRRAVLHKTDRSTITP